MGLAHETEYKICVHARGVWGHVSTEKFLSGAEVASEAMFAGIFQSCM